MGSERARAHARCKGPSRHRRVTDECDVHVRKPHDCNPKKHELQDKDEQDDNDWMVQFIRVWRDCGNEKVKRKASSHRDARQSPRNQHHVLVVALNDAPHLMGGWEDEGLEENGMPRTRTDRGCRLTIKPWVSVNDNSSK